MIVNEIKIDINHEFCFSQTLFFFGLKNSLQQKFRPEREIFLRYHLSLDLMVVSFSNKKWRCLRSKSVSFQQDA